MIKKRNVDKIKANNSSSSYLLKRAENVNFRMKNMQFNSTKIDDRTISRNIIHMLPTFGILVRFFSSSFWVCVCVCIDGRALGVHRFAKGMLFFRIDCTLCIML